MAVPTVFQGGAPGRKGGVRVLAATCGWTDHGGMPKLVLMPLFDGLQSLDLTGPLEVFTGAARYLASDHYRVLTASVGGGPIRTHSGLHITPGVDLLAAPRPHTIVVPGGFGTRDPQPELVAWLRSHAKKAARVVSVCSGAFLLAEAGLLAGRK